MQEKIKKKIEERRLSRKVVSIILKSRTTMEMCIRSKYSSK